MVASSCSDILGGTFLHTTRHITIWSQSNPPLSKKPWQRTRLHRRSQRPCSVSGDESFHLWVLHRNHHISLLVPSLNMLKSLRDLLKRITTVDDRLELSSGRKL